MLPYRFLFSFLLISFQAYVCIYEFLCVLVLTKNPISRMAPALNVPFYFLADFVFFFWRKFFKIFSLFFVHPCPWHVFKSWISDGFHWKLFNTLSLINILFSYVCECIHSVCVCSNYFWIFFQVFFFFLKINCLVSRISAK